MINKSNQYNDVLKLRSLYKGHLKPHSFCFFLTGTIRKYLWQVYLISDIQSQILFNMSLQQCEFPKIWKSANAIPLHKKDDRNLITNYLPVSLLSTVSKVFEKIVFKYVYNHLKDNFVLTDFQSGYLLGRSTVTQLIEVYHMLCSLIDNEKEVRVIFLDIAKEFDRVWHKGILHKLQKAGIDGNLLLWFESYLSDRRQRVVINGQTSEWGDVSAGVPQGAVLGPLSFLIYINDLSSEVTHCNIRFFAEDTCLFIEVDNREESVAKINADLEQINKWSKKWLVTFLPSKTKSLIVSNKSDRELNPPVIFDNTAVSEVNHHTYLGITVSFNLRWNTHVDELCTKANKHLNVMLPLKYKLDRRSLENMYKPFVRPVMEYGIVVWGGTYDTSLSKLEEINIKAMRIITGATEKCNIAKLSLETSISSVAERRDMAMLLMFYKVVNNLVPDYLSQLLPSANRNIVKYNLRNNDEIKLPFMRLETFRRSFIRYALKLWNLLSIQDSTISCVYEFKTSLSEIFNTDSKILYYYGQRWANVHHSRM